MKKALYYLIIAAFCMSVFNFCVSAVDIETPGEYAGDANANHTVAVEWVKNLSATQSALDYDGVYGAQCVDLIYYYYEQLGVLPHMDNAIDFTENVLPIGWKRFRCTEGFVPQPGDIAVWYANHSCNTCSTGWAGHIAIVTSANASQIVAVNQNYNDKMYCTSVTFNTSALHSVIRPDYSNWGKTITACWYEWYGYFIGETNAVLTQYVKFNGFSATSGSSAGCCLYSIDGTQLAQCSFDIETTYNPMSISCNVNTEMGYTLTPGTTYKYKFFVNTNGTTYYSPMQEFTTAGPSRTIIASGTCGVDGDNLTWELTEDGTLTISGTGAMADWNYNSTPWFDHRSSIAKIIVENGVTCIGKYAFYWCETLEYISIPASVFSFNNFNLSGCHELESIDVDEANPYFSDLNGVLFSRDMTELVKYPEGKEEASYTIPSGVTSIGDRAFQSALLETITLSDSIVSIGTSAFNASHIASITIPKSVACIGDGAFFSCDNLISISVDSNNSDYSDVDGVLFNKDKSKLIAYPTVKADRSYDIPEGVVCIGGSAFSFCKNLENVTIPDGVTSIADFAFDHCWKLTSIIIPDGVVSVGAYAFQGCSNLTSLTIPKSVTSIEGGACDYCSNLTIYGYKNSTAETYATENGIPFETLTSESNEVIASGICGADGDNLTWELTEDGTLTISGTGNMMDWTTIGKPDNAPWYPHRSSITKVVMESGVTFIGGEAFAKCINLVSITIPEGVMGIGINAFLSCEKLVSITLPESLIYIMTLAFQGCDSLTSITIPANVYTVAGEVFPGCDSLTDIHVDSDNSNYCDVNGVLFNKNKTVLHTYPAGKNAAAYVIPQSVETIGQFAFQGCASLTEVIIPKNVTTIETYGFSGCPNLTIYGYAGSTAETYAEERGIPFVVIRTTVTGVTLDKSSAAMDIGDILTLTAAVSPSDATDTTVFWTSSDPSVAAVTNGTVTALKAGTATITVTTVDGSKTATCVVTVNDEPVVDADVIYTIGSASGKPGSTVEVALSVSSDVAVNGLLLDNLNYDSNALEFIEFADYGELITTSALGANGVDSAKGEIALEYTDAVKPNGQICVITFRIKDTAEDGEYTIRIDGVASVNGQKLSSEVNSGNIKVSKWVSGDFDSDEKLDMKDVVYFMNWINFSWTGKYPMVYDSDKDFNKDGNIDMKDVVYFMNWVNFSWTGNYDINW